MAGELLVDEPADGIVRLTISNPTKKNALDHAILDQIAETVAAVDARCILLTGAHKMFSSGYDIGDIPDEEFSVAAEALVAHPYTAALDALVATDIPTIAALPGHTIGGGLELALCCDMRIAAEGIDFRMPPAKLGLVYSHVGLRRFLDVIGESRTREMFLLGRNVTANTALAWGLVNWLVPRAAVEAASLDIASELASNSPISVAGNKQILRELLAVRGPLTPEEEARLVELRRASFFTEDMREAVRAFAEKRRPEWQGR
jgi:enoyl-CoA hydratase/carnithine racemase